MTETKTDPTDGMTNAELADYYDAHGSADFEGGEVVDNPWYGKRLDVSISVRFTPDQIDEVRRLADEAGMKITTYIRAAALSAGKDVAQLQRIKAQLDDALHGLEQLV